MHAAVFSIRPRVLVVEDDYDLRRIFRDSLKLNGFDVRDVADGPDALRLIEDSPPDVVVLDLMLPTLDGYSVRDEIAANARTRHISIIAVTGAAVDVKRLHATRVLRKPVEPSELVAAVRACFTPPGPQSAPLPGRDSAR